MTYFCAMGHARRFLLRDARESDFPFAEALYLGTMEPLLPLQNTLNWLYSFLADSVRNSAQWVGFFDPEHITDKHVDEMRRPKDRNMIPMEGLDEAFKGDVGRFIKRFDMGGLNAEVIQAFSLFSSAFEQVSQSSDLRASAVAGIEKATTAQITQNRADNRVATLADQVELWMARSQKVLLQIAFSVMTGEDVGR